MTKDPSMSAENAKRQFEQTMRSINEQVSKAYMQWLARFAENFLKFGKAEALRIMKSENDEIRRKNEEQSQLNKDIDMVHALRQRGYTVICTTKEE